MIYDQARKRQKMNTVRFPGDFSIRQCFADRWYRTAAVLCDHSISGIVLMHENNNDSHDLQFRQYAQFYLYIISYNYVFTRLR